MAIRPASLREREMWHDMQMVIERERGKYIVAIMMMQGGEDG